jgi:hypothetical protein
MRRAMSASSSRTCSMTKEKYCPRRDAIAPIFHWRRKGRITAIIVTGFLHHRFECGSFAHAEACLREIYFHQSARVSLGAPEFGLNWWKCWPGTILMNGC